MKRMHKNFPDYDFVSQPESPNDVRFLHFSPAKPCSFIPILVQYSLMQCLSIISTKEAKLFCKRILEHKIIIIIIIITVIVIIIGFILYWL